MSSASPLRSDTAAAVRRRVGAQSLQRTVRPAVSFVGFWTAVLIPLVLLALLAAGLVARYPLVAIGLLVCNVAGLVLGRDYGR